MFGSALSEKTINRLSYTRSISRETLDNIILVVSLHREKMEVKDETESKPVAMAEIDKEETERALKKMVWVWGECEA